MSNTINNQGFGGAGEASFRRNHIQAASTGEACPISALPDEMLYSIFQCVPRQDLSSVALTCRTAARIVPEVLAEIEARNQELRAQIELAGMNIVDKSIEWPEGCKLEFSPDRQCYGRSFESVMPYMTEPGVGEDFTVFCDGSADQLKALAEASQGMQLHRGIFLNCFSKTSWQDPLDCQALAAVLNSASSPITSLHLRCWRMNSEDMGKFCQLIQDNRSLTHLALPSANFQKEDTRLLAEALRDHPSIRSLNLRGTGIGLEGAQALAEMLKTDRSLKSLGLHVGTSGGAEGLQAILNSMEENDSLEELILWNYYGGEDELILSASENVQGRVKTADYAS